jgi:hypothetical protein
LLLNFDESISSTQQSIIRSQNDEIIALRRRTAPRNLWPKDSDLLVGDLQPFGSIKYDLAAPSAREPGEGLLTELWEVFSRLNWQLQPYRGPLPTQPLPWGPSGTPIGIQNNLIGVKIRYDIRNQNFMKIAFWISKRLNEAEKSAILALPEPSSATGINKDGSVVMLPVDDVLHVEIGTKP